MKATITLLLLCVVVTLNAQSTIEKVFDKLDVRKTFDGSIDEQKPASIFFKEDHLSSNDFFNIDIAIKYQEFNLGNKNTFYLYPKVEWHKSTNVNDEQNKALTGLNFEIYPFDVKTFNDDGTVLNEGLLISPFFLVNTSYKYNFIDELNEIKINGQVSFESKKKWLPGSKINDTAGLVFQYFTYLGFEYLYLPNFQQDNIDEELAMPFGRIFLEYWPLGNNIQITGDLSYTRIVNNSSFKEDLPKFIFGINYYPGNQEHIGIGYEYKNGYDTDNRFNHLEYSSIKLTAKW